MRFPIGVVITVTLLFANAQCQIPLAMADSSNVDAKKDGVSPWVGEYLCGDGVGINFHLTLSEDGRFACIWTGCFGEYGTVRGTWSHQGDQIALKAIVSTGLFKKSPLGDIQIIKYEEEERLILKKSLQYREEGEEPSIYSIFRRLEDQ